MDHRTEALPLELADALRRFQRRWRGLQALVLLGLLLLVPLFSLGLLALSDRFWATPAWARLMLALPVPLLMAASLGVFLHRWVLRRPGPRMIARVMGRLDARVGDRLLGAVELSEGAGEAWAGSPALRRAAIAQVAQSLAGVKAEEGLDVRPGRRLLQAACVLLALFALFAWRAPEAAQNAWTRWLRPLDAIERFTFVRLSEFPDHVTVPHGEAFSFSGQVAHVRGETPPPVEARIDGPESLTVVTDGSRVDVGGEALMQSRVVRLRAGDANASVALEPRMRPELLSLSAGVRFPDYLGRAPETQALRRRSLDVPVGSRVRLSGEISRELRELLANEGTAALDGARFDLSEILVDSNQTLALQWTDVEGLGARAPAKIDLLAREDQPPRLALSGIAPAIALLPDEFVDLSLSASDDYGLTRLWISWQSKLDGMPVERITEYAAGGTSASTNLWFSPERNGYPEGSVVDLTAYALDAFPGREPVASSRFRILVISKADHAKLVRQQMDAVLGELDEYIREEAVALEETTRLAARADEDVMHESSTESLARAAREEANRADRLAETQAKMEDLLQEAAKNEEISDKTVAEFAEVAAKLKEEAAPAMRAAAEALQAAAEAGAPPPGQAGESPPSDPAERREQIQEAMARQRQALEALQQGEQDLNESIERSTAENFINRFRDLSERQSQIGGVMKELLPQTLGLTAEQLPEALGAVIRTNATGQAEILRQSRYLYDDLVGFYRRTQQPIHQEVSADMEAENYRARLGDLRGLILRNVIGKTTTESQVWSDLFAFWADSLEEDLKGRQGESQGGEGGGEGEGPDLETLIALVRAREQEETLRRHTRALDESYARNPNYHREAVGLSDRHYALSATLQPLENRAKDEKLKELISMAAGEIMNAGVMLRRPQTDQETISIQTTVIEVLAQALQQGMQGSGSGGPPPPGSGMSPAQAAALAALMGGKGSGEGGGRTGSGDPGSGLGDAAMRNRAGTGEGADKAGAPDPDRWPARYRGMMDAYFQAMEEGR